MEPVRGTFPSKLGCSLYTERWLASGGPPTALLVFVHGMGDHVGRYAPLLAHLASQRVEVVAFDQLGHGRSGEHPKRGRYNVEAFSELVADVDAFAVAALAAHEAPPPLFLMGCSLGCDAI
jgi:acylglycerol lipase